MEDLSTWSAAFPESEAAMLRMLQAERRKLETRAATLIKRIEGQRDDGVRKLERAAAIFADKGNERPRSAKRTKQRRPRKRGGGTNAEEAAKRARAVNRFMDEQARPLTCLEIARALRLPEFSTKSALRRLIKEETVVRTGTGSGTRYQLLAQRPSREERSTTQGLIVTTIEDRGTASPRELAQAVGVSEDEVEGECGFLIIDGIVRMTQRDGRPVYALQVAA